MLLSENIRNSIIFSLIGFSATGVQIILLREYFEAFSGNEISIGIVLSAWLLWTAIGSFLLGRINIVHDTLLIWIILFQLLTALAAPVTLIGIQLISTYLKSVPGETLGLLPMIISSYSLLSPFGLVSGGLFSLSVSHLNSKKSKSYAVGRVYLIESMGSALAGILLSLVLIDIFDNFFICLIISLINLIIAVVNTLHLNQKLLKVFFLSTIAVLIIGIILSAGSLQSKIKKMIWKDFRVVSEMQSHFGKYNLIESGSSKTIYLNGTVLFTIPEPAAAEETVHFAMLQHVQPKRILLIGGGLNGSMKEILKHPSVETVDYIEIDAKLIQFFKNQFPDQWKDLIDDSKISMNILDARIFLRQIDIKYDVIILNQPDPQTIQLNRFFTVEFFRMVTDRLNPSGIFSLQTSGSENYINNELAAYLGCIHHTLSAVFKDVIVYPGDMVHFFAGKDSLNLTNDYYVLVQRMNERNLQTQYIREYYLPFRLSRERIDYINGIILSQSTNRINYDFHPSAYYFNMVLWSTQFSQQFTTFVNWIETINWKIVFSLVFLLILGLIPYLSKSNFQYQISGALSILCLGFTSMGIEILILLIFQIMHGFVYQQLAILIAAFMAGLALGTYFSIRKNPHEITVGLKRLISVHLIIALFIGFLSLLIQKIVLFIDPLLQEILLPGLFILITLIAGYLGGFQFPLAGSIFYYHSKNQNPGFIYGMDLLGAMAGAFLICVFIIPLFGIYETGILLAVMNLIVVLFLVCLKLKSNILQKI